MFKALKEKKYMEVAMWIVLAWSIFCICFSMFTYGLTYIHSDNAAELLALKSIITNRDLFPDEWVYMNGDVNFMRIQVFLLLPYLLVGSKPVAREIGALLIIVLSVLALRKLSRKIFKDDSWLVAVPVIWIMLGGRATRDILMYSGMYISSIFWLAVFILLFDTVSKEKCKKRIVVAFCLLETLVLTGGTRWLAEITIPLLVVSIYLAYTEKRGFVKNILFVLVPSIAGMGIFKLVNIKCDFFVSGKSDLVLPDTLSDIGKNAIVIFKNFYECFGYNGADSIISLSGLVSVISLTACTIICFVLPIIQMCLFYEESSEVKTFLVFAFTHNFVLIMTAVLTSKLLDYHMVTVIIMDILMSARLVYGALQHSDRFLKGGFTILFIFTILIDSIFMLAASKGWKENYTKQRQFAEKLAATGAEKGFGTFWNAYTYEVYSDDSFRTGAIQIEDYFISDYFCLVDKSIFKAADCKSFLILNEEENEMYGTVEFFLDKPTEDWVEEDVPTFNYFTKQLEKHNLRVLVYDYDISSMMNNGVYDGIVKPIEMVVNENCEKNFEYISINNGGILHGPYNNIYKGNYTMQIIGSHVGELDIDIDTQYEDAISYTIDKRIDNSILININVKKSIDDLDIVLKNNGDEPVVFQNILVERY